MKKLVFSMFFVLQVVFAWSQEKTSSVTGKVVESKTQRVLENVVVTIQNTTLTALTTQEGIFVFENVVVGDADPSIYGKNQVAAYMDQASE